MTSVCDKIYESPHRAAQYVIYAGHDFSPVRLQVNVEVSNKVFTSEIKGKQREELRLMRRP